MTINSFFRYTSYIAVILGICIGCSSTKNFSTKYPYNKCIGKKFILQEDMYIFQDHDSSHLSIAGPNSGIDGLTKTVNSRYIGRDNGRLKIIGVVQKGSIFSITRVVYTKTFELSYIDFLISFNSSLFSKEEILSGAILNLNNPPETKTWSDPPIFKSEAALPLPSDGVWWK